MLTCDGCKRKYPYKDRVYTNTSTLCPECADKPRHRYYYINRPPGIGCQPEGFIDRETWMPAETIELSCGITRYFLGWVDYPAPLDNEQVWLKELWPAGEAEFVSYQDWREENDR